MSDLPDDARVARVVQQGQRRVDGTADERGLLLVTPVFGHFERVELQHQQVVEQQAADERLVLGEPTAVAVPREILGLL